MARSASPSAPAAGDKALRMSYRIGRGEQGVLSFEPYKSMLLPHWRFRSAAVARTSSEALFSRFLFYHERDDFVGMDMARKFIQMGMTRARRYANHPGGRKYRKDTGEELPRSEDHAGRDEKVEAARVFADCWRRCTAHEGYKEKRRLFQSEQRRWDKEMREKEEKGKGDGP